MIWKILSGLCVLFAIWATFAMGSLFNLATIMWLVFAGVFYFRSWANAKVKEREKEIQQKITDLFGGTLPRFHHFQDSTAIALNESKNEIVLGNPAGIVKSYPYASIRDWEIREETAGQTGGVVAGGTGGAGAAMLAAGIAQAASQKHAASVIAKANSGLFINVKDIDNPAWRISLQSQADRKRWFEILNQAINEGGVA